MIVDIERNSEFIPVDLRNKLISIIRSTLNDIKTTDSEFVINDKLCFREQRGGKITTCVMNSASFISNSFQRILATHEGCRGETKIQGQAFDGFIKLEFSGTGYKIINKDDILKVVHRYIAINNLPASTVYTL